MERFNIYYNSGTLTCFSRAEYFDDYETALRIVIDDNKYGVVYPELIKITRI